MQIKSKSPDSKIQEAHFWSAVLLTLRHLLFLLFSILSVRLIWVSLDYIPHRYQFPFALVLAALAVLSFWKTSWVLYGFPILVPLVSGMKVFGFMKTGPILSLIFAAIYLGWFCRRFLLRREGISFTTRIGKWIEVLCAWVLFSLTWAIWPLAEKLNLSWLLLAAGWEQSDPFHPYAAAYVILEGLFYYRMLELEENPFLSGRLLPLILSIQAASILFFSLLQLFFQIPPPYRIVGPYDSIAIYAPFEDIHSYGSYLILLFFFFFSLLLHPARTAWLNAIWLALLLTFSILSYSRTTWLAGILMSAGIILWSLSGVKRSVLVGGLLLGILLINLNSDHFIKSSNPFISRLGRALTVSETFSYARFVLWRRAFRSILVHPLAGMGVGNFYRNSILYQKEQKEPYANYEENAHNYFLQFASELGLPALLLFLWILFSVYRMCLRAVRNKKAPPVLKGLLWGLGAYLITCVPGHPLLLSSQQFLFWFILFAVVQNSLSPLNEPTTPEKKVDIPSKMGYVNTVVF